MKIETIDDYAKLFYKGLELENGTRYAVEKYGIWIYFIDSEENLYYCAKVYPGCSVSHNEGFDVKSGTKLSELIEQGLARELPDNVVEALYL